jgi:spore coat protein U-like protein
MRIIRNLALSTALITTGVVGLAGGSMQAGAATATATIAVSATVLSFCTISALPLLFGNYSSILLDVNTTVTIACTATTPYNVGLDLGTGTGATVALREMTNGTSTLGYQLFSDSAYSVQWGPTVGTNTVAGVATGLLTNLTVYGQIPANELATPGLYADTVTATITY